MAKQRKQDVVEQLAELNPEPRRAPLTEPAARRPLWKVFGLAAAGLATAFVLLTVIGDDGASPIEEPAFAEAAIEVAEGNPRLLVGAEGWSVEYAGEFEVDQGNIDFANGEETFRIDWDDPRYYSEFAVPKQGLGEWSHPRELGCSEEVEDGEKPGDYKPAGAIVTTDGERTPLKFVECEMRSRVIEVTFLGQRVMVQENQTLIEGEEPTSDFSLQLPPANGTFVYISAFGMSTERFHEVLDSVYATDVETWLAALPPDVVRPVDRPQIVEDMFEGLPLHPDVDVEAIKADAGALNRYQLGAKVTGAVACAWLDQWAEGVKTGDEAAMAEATEAMSDSRDWPILEEMAKEGGWSQVIWEYSAEMRKDDREALLGLAGTETIDGKTYELGPSYATGIGCDSEKRVLRKE